MMRKKCHTSVCIFIIILLISGCSFQSTNTNSVAAKINDEVILIDEVYDVFYSDYYNVVLDAIINEKLLEIKAQQLNIDTKGLKERIKKETTSNREAKTKYQIALTNEVLKKTISDEVLKDYFEKYGDSIKSDVINVTIYHLEHEIASKFITIYQRNKDVESAERELQIDNSTKENAVISNINELYHQIKDLREGEMIMIMNDNSHLVVLINEIQSGEPLNWPQDRDRILDEYLLSHTGEEKLKLIDQLRKENKIEIFLPE